MKFAFASIAIALAMLAPLHGGWFWFLLWPSVVFLWVAVVYTANAPRWLGKKPSGEIRIASVVLLLPFFFYTWGVWHLLRLFSREPIANEVAPDLWLGRRAFMSELPANVDLVADVTSEFFEPAQVRRSRIYLHFPMLDASAPPHHDFANFVKELADYKGTIYLHCAQGHGRSATIAAAVLIQRHICNSIEQAEAQLKAARPRIKINSLQRKTLTDWLARRVHYQQRDAPAT